MDKTADLKFLRENVAYLYETYVTFMALRSSAVYQEALGQQLGKVITSALGRNFLLGVAALVDEPTDISGKNENITIHVLGGVDLTPYASTIEKLKKFRSKSVAHNDRPTMHLGDDFFRVHNLEVSETKDLFDYVIEKLEQEIKSRLPRADIDSHVKEKLQELLGQTESKE